MTTDRPQQNGGCPPPDDSGCDPAVFDERACRAKGIAAQAEYIAACQADLAAARTAYDTARADYRKNRNETLLQVRDSRDDVKRLVHTIRCRIDNKRVLRCLDRATCKIIEQLECCGEEYGCCVGDCDYTTDTTELDCQAIVVLRDEMQRKVDSAKKCFDWLVAEPGKLLERVAAAKKELSDIADALKGTDAGLDLKRLYVRAVLAQRQLDRIWNGFEQTNDFVECLCSTLTCWADGCDAVSVLVRDKAVCECHEEAEQQRCENLRTNTVVEVLAMYDKLCPSDECCGAKPHKPRPADCPSDEDEDEDEDEEECDDEDEEECDDEDGKCEGDKPSVCERCGAPHGDEPRTSR